MTPEVLTDLLPIHDAASAPEGSRPTLDAARRSYGFVPHLLGVLANSPAALRAYAGIDQTLEGGTLTPAERQVVLLTVSVANRCHYCVGAHTTLAAGAGVPAPVLEAIRAERAVPDPRLGPLSDVARRLVEERGHLHVEDVDGFLEAGYQRDQLLEVVAGVAQKTLSNYTNHLADTPLDRVFGKTAWAPPEES